MAKYNMDGISDAYFGSSKQYNDYTKYLADREEEKRARQAAINEENKRMSTISASHYPNNEKNARMRDVSPAYNFGGSQYKKILGISDPAFSGGDEFVGYTEYLNERAQRNNSVVDGKPVIETKVRNNLAGNEITEKPWWAGYASSTLPWLGAKVETNSDIEMKMVLENMPKPTVYTQQINSDAQLHREQLNTSYSKVLNDTNSSMQHLKKEMGDIITDYKNINEDNAVAWNTSLAVTWKYIEWLNKARGEEYLYKFKDQWVYGYRHIIKAAAEKYDIPAELLAGVVWVEVGGDPPWFDPAARFVRKATTAIIPDEYWGKFPDEIKDIPILGEALNKLYGSIWSSAVKDPNMTSFGDVSMQIRVAAETLGIPVNQLTGDMEREIVYALQDPKFSIYIAAKHLANLKQIDFADVSSTDLTSDDIATIASRYNIGAGASYEKAAGHSYGKAVKKHLTDIVKYLLLD